MGFDTAAYPRRRQRTALRRPAYDPLRPEDLAGNRRSPHHARLPHVHARRRAHATRAPASYSPRFPSRVHESCVHETIRAQRHRGCLAPGASLLAGGREEDMPSLHRPYPRLPALPRVRAEAIDKHQAWIHGSCADRRITSQCPFRTHFFLPALPYCWAEPVPVLCQNCLKGHLWRCMVNNGWYTVDAPLGGCERHKHAIARRAFSLSHRKLSTPTVKQTAYPRTHHAPRTPYSWRLLKGKQ